MTPKNFAYLFLCAIPYPFRAMWEDAAYGSCYLYGVMLLAHSLLCRTAIGKKAFRPLLLGNAVSLLLSLLCIQLFQTEKWLWYFKPFSAEQLAFFLCAAITLWEFVVFRTAMRKENEK